MDRPGQQVLQRSSVVVNDSGIEARFTVSLPAHGEPHILARPPSNHSLSYLTKAGRFLETEQYIYSDPEYLTLCAVCYIALRIRPP